MTYSVFFRQLNTRVSSLRTNFLPIRFSPTGTYSPRQLDGTRAYVVLCHAEIEYYFEERARDIAAAAFTSWDQLNLSSFALTHLVCNFSGNNDGLPKKLGTNKTAKSLVQNAVTQFHRNISSNHGIRTRHILGLLLPIGVQESELDVGWLNTVDGFGTSRGTVAHTAAVVNAPDPQTAHSTVGQILTGIKPLDDLLNKIRKKIR